MWVGLIITGSSAAVRTTLVRAAAVLVPLAFPL
jgi:hypothetical protein